MAQQVKNVPAVQEMPVLYLGQEGSLEEEMATCSSTLFWKMPWTEEAGQLQPTGPCIPSPLYIEMQTGTSLAGAQWLRLHALSAGGPGLIPSQGTKILNASILACTTLMAVL